MDATRKVRWMDAGVAGLVALVFGGAGSGIVAGIVGAVAAALALKAFLNVEEAPARTIGNGAVGVNDDDDDWSDASGWHFRSVWYDSSSDRDD